MAPPADEYAAPSGGAGRLKLKGSSSKSQDGNRVDKHKSKKKRDKKSRQDKTGNEDGEKVSSSSPSFARPRGHEDGGDIGALDRADDGTDRDRDRRDESEGAEGDTVVVGKTEAEKRYDEARKRRLNERLKREGVKSHKERVEELNQYLSNLSEHHDMPKIGPG